MYRAGSGVIVCAGSEVKSYCYWSRTGNGYRSHQWLGKIGNKVGVVIVPERWDLMGGWEYMSEGGGGQLVHLCSIKWVGLKTSQGAGEEVLACQWFPNFFCNVSTPFHGVGTL